MKNLFSAESFFNKSDHRQSSELRKSNRHLPIYGNEHADFQRFQCEESYAPLWHAICGIQSGRGEAFESEVIGELRI